MPLLLGGVGPLQERSLALLGDVRRDQGALVRPLSAQHTYRQAWTLFRELDIPRRVAQLELSLTVVTEMTGGLHQAADHYRRLAADERLSGRDRARSRLWIGTALSKAGQHHPAVQVMTQASHQLEDQGEAEDWAVAQQKLALAYRGTGDLERALRLIDIARSSGTCDTPMQRVRLDTAHAHILVSHRGTCEDGLRLLAHTSALAAASGLHHQLRSIQAIRASTEASTEHGEGSG
ncbi:hypothetical protein ACSNOI_24040 [Actinomadura kijaniata]|uniref:hypothetical protein n=1 Tax=Actinomadura kijaniata TaxID=46161 RepID=UPI003F1B997B